MEIVEKVEQAVTRTFKGSEPQIEWDPEIEQVAGVILWDGFGTMDHGSRQMMLWDALRDALGQDIGQVSLILTYTSREYDALMAA